MERDPKLQAAIDVGIESAEKAVGIELTLEERTEMEEFVETVIYAIQTIDEPIPEDYNS